MKIVFFTGHFYPHLGGVEKYNKELITRLTQKGYKCVLVTNNTNQAPAEEYFENIKVFRLPTLNLFHNEFPITLPFWKTFQVLRKIVHWQPDTVVTNTRYFIINALATFISNRFLRTKRIHIEHGSDFVRFRNPFLNYISRFYDRLIGGYVLRNTYYCGGVSKQVNIFLQENFHKQCNGVLYNCVDTKQINKKLKNIRTTLGISASDIIIGYAGRLIKEKGILLLMNVFEKISSSVANPRNVHLLIAGKGPLESFIKHKTKNNPTLHFLGGIPPSKMSAFYNTIDIFAFPSSYPEGFPSVILEAGLFGKHIITTKRGGTNEIIINSEFGTIIPENDPKSLENALAECIKKVNKDKFNTKIQDYILHNFDWDVTVKTIENILKD